MPFPFSEFTLNPLTVIVNMSITDLLNKLYEFDHGLKKKGDLQRKEKLYCRED